MDETLKRRLVGVSVLSLIVLIVAWWLPDRDDGQKRLNPERLPTETRVYDIHALDQRAAEGEDIVEGEAASPPNVDVESEVAFSDGDAAVEEAETELEAAPVQTAGLQQSTPKPASAPVTARPKPDPSPVVTAKPQAAPKPATESKPEPIAKPPAAERAPVPEPAPKVAEKPKPAAPVPDKPAAEPSKALPTGDWIVQVGSFGKQENAESMRKKLAAKGYRVSVSSGDVSGRTYHRVRVGPYTKKTEAQSAAGKLEAFLGQKVAVLKNH